MSELQWVLNTYLLALASLILTPFDLRCVPG